MAHLTDGTLRRMVDDTEASTAADSAHLDGCADCKDRYDAIADDARSIATLLSAPEVKVDVAAAYSRVMRAPKAQPALGLIRLPFLRPVNRPVRGPHCHAEVAHHLRGLDVPAQPVDVLPDVGSLDLQRVSDGERTEVDRCSLSGQSALPAAADLGLLADGDVELFDELRYGGDHRLDRAAAVRAEDPVLLLPAAGRALHRRRHWLLGPLSAAKRRYSVWPIGL